MTTIEEKSLLTQQSLMQDIISNFRGITYSVTERGKELREHLSTKKICETENTVTIEKEVFDKMLDIAYILQDKDKWDQLGILAKSAVPENEIKLKILNQLT